MKNATAPALTSQLRGKVTALENTYAEILKSNDELKASLEKMHHISDELAKVTHIVKELKPLGAKLRAAADHAEGEVADEFWMLPKYREMLFNVKMR